MSDEHKDTGYVFVSHRSACEALRANGIAFPLWPSAPRLLPTRGDCVVGQRELRSIARTENFDRLGLVSRPVDILVPNSQFRHKGQHALTHPWSNLLPARSMLRVRDRVLVSTPEFTILQLANVHVRHGPNTDRTVDRHLAERQALAQLGMPGNPEFEDFRAWEKIAAKVRVAQVVMEFVGSYRLGVPSVQKTTYRQSQLTDLGRIVEFVHAIPRAHTYRHSTAFSSLKMLLPWVMEHSRSPMETALSLMLTMPVDCGGFGLPKPQLNKTPQRFGEHDSEADLLWEEAKLVLEYDSAEFHAAKGRDKVDADIMRANRMRAAGYAVMEVTPGIAMDPNRLDTLARQLAGLLSVDLKPEDHVVRFRREMLHGELFGVREP